MKRTPIFLGLLGLLIPALHAQPVVDGHLGTFLSGDTLTVRVQLRGDPGTEGLGTSTVQFTYNDAALAYARGAFDNYNGSRTTYSGGSAGYTSTITRPASNKVSLNVVLGFTSDENGQALPAAFTDVATLVFVVTDRARNALLAWSTRAIYTGPGTRYASGRFTVGDGVLPVELIAFEGVVDGDAAVLRWTTASETNNAGFGVEREAAGRWHEEAFVDGAGTRAEPRRYAHRVEGLAEGRHRFRLRQVDLDGAARYSAHVEVTVEAPRALALRPNHPNPFSAATEIAFTVPRSGRARLVVYDVLGREVARLFDGAAEAGPLHRATFDGGALASGLYVAVLHFDGQQRTIPLLLAR